MQHTISTQIDTPIGTLGLVASQEGLCRILFPGQTIGARERWFHKHFGSPPSPGAHPLLKVAERQLTAYFEQTSPAGFNIPLDLRGSPFQCQVWHRLADIPSGTVVSYQELAAAIGRPGAVRAVGAANGANPLPILLPCHRVVGSDGALTGFGGGLDLKMALLELEGVGIRRHPSGRPDRFRVVTESNRQGELWS